MNPNQTPMSCGCQCSCKHHIITPISIILIGLAFIAGTMGYISMDAVNLTWPFLLVLIGVTQFCKCCGCKH